MLADTLSEPMDWEVDAMKKALERHNENAYRPIRNFNKVKVAYRDEGNFTYAHVLDGNYLYTGIAKRNPRDGKAFLIGANIALTRAVLAYPVKIK